MEDKVDVVVVGAGNAGLCAALAAREAGASVLVLEKSSPGKRGGNSTLTGGRFRVPHGDLEDMASITASSSDELTDVEMPAYDASQFRNDLLTSSRYRSNEQLLDVVVREARDGLDWLRTHGARFELPFGGDELRADGKTRFSGGDDLRHVGAGEGLMDNLFRQCETSGIRVRYETAATSLERGINGVDTVHVRSHDGIDQIHAGAVVLASGGFEANPQMRAAYLGPGWDLAKVRGSQSNTGDGLRMAVDLGAQPYGHWSGCHSVAWDYFAPDEPGRKSIDSYQRYSYSFGITVNRQGERFFDEGSDLRAYTYSSIGSKLVAQENAYAVQIFDAKTLPFLRNQYRSSGITRAECADLKELANELNVDAAGVLNTVARYNESASEMPFIPTMRDGKSTSGIVPRKSNWAVPIDTPPYYGFPVTVGITFTYGGLRTTASSEVMDSAGAALPGLFAAGEILGGLFYYAYPGGTGLVTGLVFGRRAGRSAANFAKHSH